MGKLIFILGGARSGKSSFALRLASDRHAKNVAFIATGEALDKEMRRRVRLHRNSRPAHWKTFEEPRRVAEAIKEMGGRFELILIDCLTLLVSNLLLNNTKEKAIEKEITMILNALRRTGSECIIVSNEVGLGIVPGNALARDFRDVAGRVNQIVAKAADEVFFTVSGIPWRIK